MKSFEKLSEKPSHSNRILFIGRQFYPCIGGTESATLEMAKRLVKRGYKVGVLALNRNFRDNSLLPEHEIYHGIEIYRVPFVGPRWKPFVVCNPIWLSRLFAQYDLLHLKDVRFAFEQAILARLLMRKPLVISSYGFILHQKKNILFKRAFFEVYLKPLFRAANFLLASTDLDYERVKWVYPKSRLIRFDLGVDCEKFAVAQPKPEKGRLLYFGRLDLHKGVDLLFEVLGKLGSEFRLEMIYGSSDLDYRGQLRTRAIELGINDQIEWTGLADEARLLKALERAQYVMIPSRYEGFGLTTLEAMAAGAVPVVNDIPAFRSIVEDGKDGWILNFENVEFAASRLKELLHSGPSEQMRLASRKKARAFDWEEKISQLEEIYERCLG